MSSHGPNRKPGNASSLASATNWQGLLQRKCACGGSGAGLSGECEECRKQRFEASSHTGGLVQRRTAAAAREVSAVPPIVHEVLRSSGQPLDDATRAFFEPRFGHDFSRVRIHTGARAAESARAVNALAYTVGRNIVFDSGQHAPAEAAGRGLLAHELTHVIQQGRLNPGEPFRRQPEDSLNEGVCEREAREAEERFLSSPDGLLSVVLTRSPGMLLSRKDKKSKKKLTKKAKPLTLEQVKSLIAANNKSVNVSAELLLCLIWKESDFNPKEKNPKTTATGLMQITKGAVVEVNKNSPKGVHFEHSEMTDPAKNIQCGTRYVDIRIKWAGGDVTAGLEGYGTGKGYADNLYTCQTCLQAEKEDPETCLHTIHA